MHQVAIAQAHLLALEEPWYSSVIARDATVQQVGRSSVQGTQRLGCSFEREQAVPSTSAYTLGLAACVSLGLQAPEGTGWAGTVFRRVPPVGVFPAVTSLDRLAKASGTNHNTVRETPSPPMVSAFPAVSFHGIMYQAPPPSSPGGGVPRAAAVLPVSANLSLAPELFAAVAGFLEHSANSWLAVQGR